MTQPKVLQRTSVIYLNYLTMKVLPPPRYQKGYYVLPFPPLSGYHVQVYGFGEIFWITIRGDVSIQQFPNSIERSKNMTRTRHTLIIFFDRSEEHTSELQSQSNLVCRLLLEKKKKTT